MVCYDVNIMASGETSFSHSLGSFSFHAVEPMPPKTEALLSYQMSDDWTPIAISCRRLRAMCPEADIDLCVHGMQMSC